MRDLAKRLARMEEQQLPSHFTYDLSAVSDGQLDLIVRYCSDCVAVQEEHGLEQLTDADREGLLSDWSDSDLAELKAGFDLAIIIPLKCSSAPTPSAKFTRENPLSTGKKLGLFPDRPRPSPQGGGK